MVTRLFLLLMVVTVGCKSCRQPVITGGGYANGHLYHAECFNCAQCGARLDSKFSSAGGRILCQPCFKLYEKCCQLCQLPIHKDCVESNEKFYHAKCMKCGECGCQLDGLFYLLGGRYLCEPDYLACKKSCSQCDELIDGLYYTDSNNKILCEKDYKARLGECRRCGRLLEGAVLKVGGGAYHTSCFSCAECGVGLAATQVALDPAGRDVYCETCHAQLFAVRCAECGDPISPASGATTAPRLTALGRDFHPDCFRCSDCRLILEDGCYPLDNTPFCMDCHETRLYRKETNK